MKALICDQCGERITGSVVMARIARPNPFGHEGETDGVTRADLHPACSTDWLHSHDPRVEAVQ